MKMLQLWEGWAPGKELQKQEAGQRNSGGQEKEEKASEESERAQRYPD